MPQVDMTLHPCKWCGTTERTFVCDDCNRYTCRECKVAVDEAGCVHIAAAPVISQSWCEISGVRLDEPRKYTLYIGNPSWDSSMLTEYRQWQK